MIRTARAADGSGGWFVAECAVTNIEGEASRRARLFAASPRILAALQLLVAETIERRGPSDSTDAALQAITAALEG